MPPRRSKKIQFHPTLELQSYWRKVHTAAGSDTIVFVRTHWSTMRKTASHLHEGVRMFQPIQGQQKTFKTIAHCSSIQPNRLFKFLYAGDELQWIMEWYISLLFSSCLSHHDAYSDAWFLSSPSSRAVMTLSIFTTANWEHQWATKFGVIWECVRTKRTKTCTISCNGNVDTVARNVALTVSYETTRQDSLFAPNLNASWRHSKPLIDFDDCFMSGFVPVLY